MTHLNDRYVDRYWKLVEDILLNIFKVDPSKTPIRRLRYQVSQFPEDQEDLFYHAEPLDIAADLAHIPPEALRGVLDAYHLLRQSLFDYDAIIISSSQYFESSP